MVYAVLPAGGTGNGMSVHCVPPFAFHVLSTLVLTARCAALALKPLTEEEAESRGSTLILFWSCGWKAREEGFQPRSEEKMPFPLLHLTPPRTMRLDWDGLFQGSYHILDMWLWLSVLAQYRVFCIVRKRDRETENNLLARDLLRTHLHFLNEALLLRGGVENSNS